MNADGFGLHSAKVFQAGPVRFDEARGELLVHGQRCPIEGKPRALLYALLTHGPEIATKRDLIAAVWGNADHMSETSLTTAMSKLRGALGEQGRAIIEAVHGVGYRITAPVEVLAAEPPAALALGFQPGDPVAGRPRWRMERLLGAGTLRDTWLVRHDTTGESRVLKFADSSAGLDALRTKVALSRLLHGTLGDRDDLVRFIEWNFESRPYFIESHDGGADLRAWADRQGGLAAVSMDQRVAMVAHVARTIAAAHGAGVLHGAIKPGNVLVSDVPGKPPLLRVVDFGAAGGGTPGYVAPEMVSVERPTAGADVYALGILLYQMAAGSFAKPLGAGWEADIGDEVLREDIEASAASDPARRLASAASLAERLDAAPARRSAREQGRRDAARSADLARRLERSRLLRPWIAASSFSLAAGLAMAIGFGVEALHDRDRARKRTALAQAVNAFLTEDLLGRGDPARSGRPDETLMQAAAAAEGSVDRRLATEPMEAGAITLSLAHTYESRSADDDARRAYIHAAAAFAKAGPQGAAYAVIAQLRQAAMEASSGQAGSLPRATALVAAAAPRVAGLGPQRPEAEIWLWRAQARLAEIGGDFAGARDKYLQAADRADTMPDLFDEASRLALRRDLASTYICLKDWRAAKDLLSKLMQRELALNGPRHAETLRVAFRLAEARAVEGDLAGALSDLNRIQPVIEDVFGPDHRVTLTSLAIRADVLSRLGRYDESFAMQTAIYRRFAAHDGPRSWTALATLADAAETQCRAGHAALGLQDARTAYDGALEGFGETHVLTQDAAGSVAFCLILEKQYSQAAGFLDRLDAKAVGDHSVEPQYPAKVALMRADIALATGDRAAAKRMLARVAPVFELPDADRYMQAWARRLSSMAETQQPP